MPALGFETILNSALGALPRTPPARPATLRMAPDPSLLFTLGDRPVPRFVACTPYGRPAAAAGAAPLHDVHVPRDPASPGTPVPRTERALKALEVLRRAGADRLGRDSTDTDVRQAYRRLALRYHPDRNLGIPSAERVRRAALFADLSAAYRVVVEECRAADPTRPFLT
jgi:hypothetical protein